MERPAIDMRAPVRSAPLPGGYPGATAIDADEVACRRRPPDQPRRIEACITPRTRAIMVVHWRGLAVPLQPILAVANAHGVPVIEDCAQSLGARDDGFEVGARGRINAFSFQMNKVLTAGEGGMIATDDPDLADMMAEIWRRARATGDHGILDTHYAPMRIAAVGPEL